MTDIQYPSKISVETEFCSGDTKNITTIGEEVTDEFIEIYVDKIKGFLTSHDCIIAMVSDTAGLRWKGDVKYAKDLKYPNQDDFGMCKIRKEGKITDVIMTCGDIYVRISIGDTVLICEHMVIIENYTTDASGIERAIRTGLFLYQ